MPLLLLSFAGACVQLQLAASITPAPTLQALLAMHEAAYASQLEQKQLHMTVLSGDLARVQALYLQLAVPADDLHDPTMLESVGPDSDDLSKARTLRVQAELVRLQGVMAARTDAITSLLCELSGAWSRLGYGAADVKHAAIDVLLMEESDKKTPLPPTPATLAALHVRKAELDAAASSRRAEIESKTAHIAALHKRLTTPAEAVAALHAQFAAHASSAHPLSAGVLAFYESEIASLEKLKQARMQGLVFDLRAKIDAVYSDLQMSAAERSAFVPFQSMVYNDAVLEMHEAELARVIERRAQLQPVFAAVGKWKSMRDEVAAFEVSSADPTRLTKRGSHLILAQEEKLRKKRDVSLPALERKLLDQVVDYEALHVGDTVTIQGVSLRAQLEASMAARDDCKSARRKQDADQLKAKKDADKQAVQDAANGKPSSSAPAATPLKAGNATGSLRPSSAAPTPIRAAAPVMATPRQPRAAVEAATPMSAAKVAPMLPSIAAAAAGSALPVIAATPLKTSRAPPVPLATPVTPATSRPVMGSRIPTFGTTSTSLQTVHATPTQAAAQAAAQAAGNNENAENPSGTATPVQAMRAVLGELRSTTNPRVATIREDDDCAALVKAAAPVPAAAAAAGPVAPLSLESLDLDVAATLMADVHARVAVCESDADRLQVYYQAITSVPAPTLAQLSKLHYARAKLYEAAREDELAEQDLALSHQYLLQHKASGTRHSAGAERAAPTATTTAC